jgi:predicted chitinase
MRDPKSGRMLSKFESLSKQSALQARQYGQSGFEQELLAMEAGVEDDSRGVQGYVSQLTELVRAQEGNAVGLRQILPLIAETARIAQKEDPTLSDAEKRRVRAACDKLTTFIQVRTTLTTRLGAHLSDAIKRRGKGLREGVSEHLANSESGLFRFMGRMLRPKDDDDREQDTGISALLKAKSKLFSTVAKSQKVGVGSAGRSYSSYIDDEDDSIFSGMSEGRSRRSGRVSEDDDVFSSPSPRRSRRETAVDVKPNVTGFDTGVLSLILTEVTGIHALLRRNEDEDTRAAEQDERDADNKLRFSPKRLVEAAKKRGGDIWSKLAGFTASLISMAPMLLLAAKAALIGVAAAAVGALAYKVTQWADKITGGVLSKLFDKMMVGFKSVSSFFGWFGDDGTKEADEAKRAATLKGDLNRMKQNKEREYSAPTADEAAAEMDAAGPIPLASTPTIVAPAAPIAAPEPVAVPAPNTPRRNSAAVPTPPKVSDTPKRDERAPRGPGKKVGEQLMMAAMLEAGITDKTEQAALLAQVSHESAGFTALREKHNGKNADEYFTKKYGHRKDLGNIMPSDGPRYRGRGFIQLTGRANYETFGRKIGVDLVNNPQLAEQPRIAAKLAVAFWQDRVSSKLNTKGWRGEKSFTNIKEITRRVNGGDNGLRDREAKFAQYQNSPVLDTMLPPARPTPTPQNVPLMVRNAAPVAQHAATSNVSHNTVVGPTIVNNQTVGGQQRQPTPRRYLPTENPDAAIRAALSING